MAETNPIDDTPLAPAPRRTLERKPRNGRMIKAHELINVYTATGFSLLTRRIYNLLLANAHTRMSDPHAEHVISLKELRNARKSNERLEPALLQLMTTVVEVKIHGADGEAAIRRVQFLGGNDLSVDKPNGILRYTFDPRLIDVLQESAIYAQLSKEVLYAFESKYSMALYELIEERVNLKNKVSEDFSLERLRVLLDVPQHKLVKFSQLNQTVLKRAVAEVNQLADFRVELTPLKTGRKVTGIRLSWLKKSDAEAATAIAERRRHRVGRSARRDDLVEEQVAVRTKLEDELSRPANEDILDGDGVEF